MLLAVDIGNTNIAMGLFRGNRIIRRLRLETVSNGLTILKEVRKALRSCKAGNGDIDIAIISSVVPSASKVIRNVFTKQLKIRTVLLGKELKVPIDNHYKRPEQVGQDRLVNSFACLQLYRVPAIIVDFGTTTTFDYIDKKGAYMGGIIAPGAELTIKALYENTALLPKITIKKPRRLIGKDTTESIRSGIVNGIAAMCDGLISSIKSDRKSKPIVIATGGLSNFFAPLSSQIDKVDKDLTLKGINCIYLYS